MWVLYWNYDIFHQLLDPNTHVLHGVCIFLLIEVVIKRSHVRLFKIGLKDREKRQKKKKLKKEKEEDEAMYRSGFGEASQCLDGLGDESEGSRGGGILAGQNYGFHENACLKLMHNLKIRLTGWCGRRWNKLGERMAGAKKRRKIKLLTAVKRTSGSTIKIEIAKSLLFEFWIQYNLVCRSHNCWAI